MSFRSLLLVSLFGFFLSNVALAATPAEQLRSADKLINEVDAIWTGGDHTTIEAKLRRALEIRQELLGSDHALVGDVLGRMGRNEWNRHDYAAAEPLFRRAVAIGERAEPSSFNTARLLGDLGATLRVRGKYAEAEALVRRSVEMRRHLRPPNQPFVASGLDNLGRVLTAEHRYAEAEEAVAESLNIRRAALGPDHEMTRGSEAFLNGLRTVRNPWRIAQREGLILAVCLLGLVVLVSQRLYAGRRAALAINTNLTNPAPPVLSGGEVALELLLYSVRFGCGAGAGYATYLAAVTLLPLYLPILDDRNLGKLAWVSAILGFVAFLVLDNRISDVARRICGLPPQVPITPTNATAQIVDKDVRRAVSVGRLWVNMPAVFLIGATVASMVIVLKFSGSELTELKGPLVAVAVLVIFLLIIFASGLVGWLWWAVMVPRWQVWAMRRVRNLKSLELNAIQSGLIWETDTKLGRFLARTAWWTRALRKKADAIRRAKAGAAPHDPNGQTPA